MRKPNISAALVMGALATLLIVSVVSASQDNNSDRSRADEVRAHWTAERLQAATPRDFVLTDHGRIIPLPGNGNGKGKPGGSDDGDSGDSGSAEVTGASWTADGPAKSTTGKVYFEIGNSGYVCSGTVVTDSVNGDGRSTVLTAGHCLYDEGSNGSFVQNLVFIPDFDSDPSSAYYDCSIGEAGSNCWVADHLVTSKQWADGGTDKWSEDYGFAIFLESTNGTSLEGSVGDAYSVLTDTYSLTTPQAIHAFGYPAAKKYDGSDLVYCAGDDGQLNDGNPETTAIKCKMTGGASGGAWLKGFDPSTQSADGIRSLTSYSYASTNGYLFGPIFDDYTQSVFDVALTSSGDTVVDGTVGS